MFEKMSKPIFGLIIGHMNKYWIRQDFFKRYELQDVIGKGGFASVNIVVRVDDRKMFAAKAIKKDRINKDKERLYFINELRVSRLFDHPLIVKTLEVHEMRGQFIIIQDYIEGVNLLQYIKIKKTLTESVALHVVYQLLRAVYYMHQLGIIHRDIKPQNIMLKMVREEKKLAFKEKYEVILIDFGLCADFKDHSPTSFLHDKSGTTGYLAPEVIKSSTIFYNDKVDIFSIGVVFVEMYFVVEYRVIGKNPFKAVGNRQMLINNYMCNINFSETHLTKNSQKLAKKLLCKDTQARPCAKQALEDEIFCSSDSGINLNIDFYEGRFAANMICDPTYFAF